MNIFIFDNYKKFVLFRFESMPKRGYGQKKRLAEFLSVSTTYISQVLTTEKSLSSEQAVQVAEYLALSDLETDYFVMLVQIEKAGSTKLKNLLNRQLNEIRIKANVIQNRLEVHKVLTDEEKVIFYSDWYYSAIRLLTSIEEYQTVDALVERTGLDRKLVIDVLNYLVKSGLCVKQDSKYLMGPKRTHLDKTSKLIKLHHNNWRLKALEDIKIKNDLNLHYSSPMSLSLKDCEKIQSLILKLIEEAGDIVTPSNPEELMCLNIDWFKVS